MKFREYKYERPDFNQAKTEFESIIEKFENAKSGLEQIKLIEQSFKLFDDIDSMATLVSIRNSINTKDKFYEKESELMDENMPQITNYSNMLDKLVVKSAFKDELKAHFGDHYFNQIEVSLKAFDEKLIPLMVEESKLSREYSKLLAGAQIEFDGEIYNLSQMSPFTQSTDRETRHEAQLKVSEFFKENEQAIDNIYDKLVHLRDDMAKSLGYKNYIELGYYRMGRTDYGQEEVANYRKQIKNVVVPAVSKLTARKAKRLGIKDLKSYDTIAFLSGNPTPKGTKDELIGVAKKMYQEMSKETNEFFNSMLEHDLFDLESKPGKQGGGYCTYIPKYNSPFIFANFNGTAHDVDVLTHEAGHAFQVYSSRDHIPAQRWPGMEGAEIHSMSMEFF